ncbi:PH domain-containing protein [Halosolutus amylolyticus]|uniref:PH domain-containing protein n=1 Tax=Halosolutus amylolyticus TaxID=2932267 RepID=A0ABD5PMJ1_9EURY|nr:PH domain-containing protein [Halosolutus amylolyticus]
MNRLHPLSAVFYALQYAFVWLWIPIALVIGLSSVTDLVSAAWAPFAAPLGLLAGVGYGIAYYYRFEYAVTETTVDVASGVIARRSREIPYRRIQNVDVRQGVVQRLLGLAIVSIETAGGGNSEATLNFVSEAEAERLQREIRRRTAAVKERRRRESGERADTELPTAESDRPTESDAVGEAETATESTAADDIVPEVDSDRTGPIDPGSTAGESDRRGYDGTERAIEEGIESGGERAEPIDRLEPRRKRLFDLESRELLLYSFTSFRPAAIAAVTFAFFLATDTILDLLVTVAQPFGGPQDLATGDAQSYGIFTVISAINGVLVTYLVSVAYTFTTYYDFRLGRAGEDFVYERGLLQRYSGSIPVEKVQSVTITDNPVQRLIGYAGLWVETAGYGPDSDSGSQSAVPLAKQGRVHRFTENLTGVETPTFHSPPTLARRRYLVRFSLVALVVVAIAFGIAQVTPLDRWYLAAIVFVAVPPAAHLRYVHLGYAVGEDHLVIRRGFWRRRTTVIPYYRIQTVNTRRSIFQRRLGLASLVVDTASSRDFFWSTPTIYDVHLADARDVHGTSRDRLQSALRDRARADDVGLEVDFT